MDGSSPPRRRRALAALALAALLAAGPATALPAAAVAQSAGDEQYVDPLAPGDGGGGEQGGDGGDGGQAPTQPQGGSGETPAPEAVAPAEPSAPATGSDLPATSGGAEGAAATTLPRTGAEAWLLALAGFALLGVGALLRPRVAPRARR